MHNTPAFCFGVFADTHYALRPHDGVRYYQTALQKLRDILGWFDAFRPDFIVCLGDVIDCRTDGQSPQPQLDEIAALLAQTGLPVYLVLGNHDVCALPRQAYAGAFCFEERGYYTFLHKGVRFVVLDTNYGPNGHPYTAQTMVWDNAYVDTAQLQWLHHTLAAAVPPAVVLAHANLDPRFDGGVLDPHVVKNHQNVRNILAASGKVRLLLQGHCHTGGRSLVDGIPYHTLRAVVEGRGDNYAMVVHCGEDKTFTTTEYNARFEP